MSLSKKTSGSPFSLDATQAGVDVPSVTRLLNRKKMAANETEKTRVATKAPSSTPLPAFSLEEPPGASPTLGNPAIQLEPDLFTAKEATAVGTPEKAPITAVQNYENEISITPDSDLAIEHSPKKSAPSVISQIKASPRGKNVSATEFARQFKFWKLTELEQSKDSLSLELTKLMKSGANGVLFLAIQAPSPGEKRPRFSSVSCVNSSPSLDKARGPFWESVSWDPQTTPEYWNKIVKEGWFEVSATKAHILKDVFGCESAHALTMIRIGTAQNCSGVLVVLSAESLKPELTQTLLKAG